MSTGVLRFSIMTPRRLVWEGEASEVVLPAYDGERGVLPDHADFIGVLGTGVLRAASGGKTYFFVISEGVYHIHGGELKVLARMAESPSEIDAQKAAQSLAKIEKQLPSINFNIEEPTALLLEASRCKARIKISQSMSV